MTFNKTLILWVVLSAFLISCAPTISPDACAGWRAIRPTAATVDYLGAHDETTLAALIGHHETGVARGCWK